MKFVTENIMGIATTFIWIIIFLKNILCMAIVQNFDIM
jgi:hypothetical protein